MSPKTFRFSAPTLHHPVVYQKTIIGVAAAKDNCWYCCVADHCCVLASSPSARHTPDQHGAPPSPIPPASGVQHMLLPARTSGGATDSGLLLQLGNTPLGPTTAMHMARFAASSPSHAAPDAGKPSSCMTEPSNALNPPWITCWPALPWALLLLFSCCCCCCSWPCAWLLPCCCCASQHARTWG